MAFEAADCGLLSSDLAAGIRRVKGLKKNGIRLGNWLTAEQARSLWQAPETDRMKGKRDRAMLALMVACGLRRHEVVSLRAEDLQQREEHWAIVDLVGKAGHIRTVPMPEWVHIELSDWLRCAGIERGKIFRKISRFGRVCADGISDYATLSDKADAVEAFGESIVPGVATVVILGKSWKAARKLPASTRSRTGLDSALAKLSRRRLPTGDRAPICSGLGWSD